MNTQAIKPTGCAACRSLHSIIPLRRTLHSGSSFIRPWRGSWRLRVTSC
jgi:hypothetical protein